ncbi:MAG: 30S ribosomal protein S7 [Nanoarchaeota archaeon]|nr:30S ribosomal protein S7 [Nanoarchaeota archaeon]
MEFLIFDKYSTKDVVVEDTGLKRYISLDSRLMLKSHGRTNTEKFGKAKMNILERLIGMIGVPGHRGKKHKIITSQATGKYQSNTKILLKALEIIEKKTGKNPIQVVVKAVENSAPQDEVTVIEYGGARYPQAVDVAPSRRISLAIRWLVQGAYDKSFNKKTKIYEGLADELIKASEGSSGESFAAKKKEEAQKQADSAR